MALSVGWESYAYTPAPMTQPMFSSLDEAWMVYISAAKCATNDIAPSMMMVLVVAVSPSDHWTKLYPWLGTAVMVTVSPRWYLPAPMTCPAWSFELEISNRYSFCWKIAVSMVSLTTWMVYSSNIEPSDHFTNSYSS